LLKARLRKKKSSTDGSDPSANSGDLDLNSRVIIRRPGKQGRNGHVSTSSDDDETNNLQKPTKQIQVMMNGLLDNDSDDARSVKSTKSTKSTKSQLDEVSHRRKNKGEKPKSQRSLGKSSSGAGSVDLRRMAKEAHARRMEKDNKSSDGNDSFGSRKSTNSKKGGKKDPLHNLLFKKKKQRDSSMTSDASALNDDFTNTGMDKNHRASEEMTTPPQSPERQIVPYKSSKAKKHQRMSQEQEVERIKLCYSWYGRLLGPTRDAFTRRISGSANMDGLEESDVDLLPWIHNGARLNVSAMTKLMTKDLN
jgi:hypothetical protein